MASVVIKLQNQEGCAMHRSDQLEHHTPKSQTALIIRIEVERASSTRESPAHSVTLISEG